MKMVQVTSEAKARPIMTALTTTSADLNIVQGDNSLSSAGGGLQQFGLAAPPALAARVEGCGRLRAAWGGAAGELRCGGRLLGCRATGGAAGVAFCWADDGAASDQHRQRRDHRKCRHARKRHVLHTSAQ